jgi:hypothetical protein
VDSLDTLYIMGMDEEFEKAKEWVTNNLDMSTMVRRCSGSGSLTSKISQNKLDGIRIRIWNFLKKKKPDPKLKFQNQNT